jgi:hypothetical protein
MTMQSFLVPAIFAAILLTFVAVMWGASRSEAYWRWAAKDAERAAEEKASRPEPPWAGDPIAESIEWTGTSEFGADQSANPKGAMVRISSVSPNRIEFGLTSARPVYAWMLFFSAVGFFVILVELDSFATALLSPLLCMSFGGIVWLTRYLTHEPLVFDKRSGLYWRGRRSPARDRVVASSERMGRISDIHALQLIGTRRYVGGDPRMGAESDHREILTHELNLVLKDRRRLSTVCLDDYDGLDHDAQVLAAFLQRPLWKPR